VNVQLQMKDQTIVFILRIDQNVRLAHVYLLKGEDFFYFHKYSLTVEHILLEYMLT